MNSYLQLTSETNGIFLPSVTILINEKYLGCDDVYQLLSS